MKHLFFLLLSVVCFLSCGDTEHNTTDNPTVSKQSSTTYEAAITDGQQLVTIEADDNMKFNIKEVKLKANIPVVLTLKHIGTAPKSSMGHNIVILHPDVNTAEFVNQANNAQATDYIPEALQEQIVAHTNMLGGGESDTKIFTCEVPGTYVFICTFPGHSMMMKGKFIVE